MIDLAERPLRMFLKLRIPLLTMEKIKAVAPAGNVSYFIREAVEEGLAEAGSPPMTATRITYQGRARA